MPFLALLAGSFFVSLILTPVFRDLFQRFGLYDQPDSTRKLHTHPIPRVGGLVLVISLAATYGLALALNGRAGFVSAAQSHLIWALLPGAGIVFATGLLDDLISLRPWQKLAGQLMGAGWAYWAGLRIVAVAGYSAEDWLALPLTLFWLVLCMNAFNLIDGVDGLATGAGLFATLTMVLAALISKNFLLAAVTLPLAGFLLGFLRYNFNPATVFLGDSGSLLIGFLLGCYGVIWSQKSATLLGMTAPLMALFVPILDVALSVVRRFLRHQPIFGADRDHIHHKLLGRGLTPRRAVLLLYGACTLGALFSIAQSVATQYFGGLIVLLFCGATWIGVQHLGYVEFNMAGRMLLSGSFQKQLDSQIQLRKFEQALSTAATIEECWAAMVEGSRALGFHGVELDLGYNVFREGADCGAGCWTVRIPLAGRKSATLTTRFDSPLTTPIVSPVVQMLRGQLMAKLESMAGPRAMAHSAD